MLDNISNETTRAFLAQYENTFCLNSLQWLHNTLYQIKQHDDQSQK